MGDGLEFSRVPRQRIRAHIAGQATDGMRGGLDTRAIIASQCIVEHCQAKPEILCEELNEVLEIIRAHRVTQRPKPIGVKARTCHIAENTTFTRMMQRKLARYSQPLRLKNSTGSTPVPIINSSASG